MSRIIVLGAGFCGLVTGMVLVRDGHEVTMLERDDQPAPGSPDQAWEGWSRNGVNQFRQPHLLQPRGRAVLEALLPDVLAGLEEAGGVRWDPLQIMPPSITDRAPRPGDERFVTIAARRPALEQVLGRAAEAEPGLDLRRGVAVKELTRHAYNGTPHVTGVRTDAGEELSADLVVDATGRRSPLPRWLSEAGARPAHEEAEDAGFIYYTRFFRSLNGATPQYRAPVLTSLGTFSVLTLPGDNNTWSVTIYISKGDQPLKRLRDRDRWTSVVAACPRHAHWLEGEPITDVLAMGGILDRYRRLLVDGRPVATGIAPLADAWACTNPALGRGMTLGLLHIQHLRNVIRSHVDNPAEFAEMWDAVTEAELTPWYRETVAENRDRLREIEALRNGLERPEPTEPTAALRAAMFAVMGDDAEAFRAFLEYRCCITPQRELFARSSLVERILELAREKEPQPPPGPDRDRLLALLN
jgi:2-polyprenyl-6-methoxyphenol hydroxylase-like FAD-dependent oxidoreductase